MPPSSPPAEPVRSGRARPRVVRHAAALQWRARRLPPPIKGIAWAVAAGLFFSGLNATSRALAREVDPFQAQFLRYLGSVVLMLPLVLRSGFAAWRPYSVRGQAGRGMLHFSALALWFFCLPHVTLPEITAIAFVQPIFIMFGAALFLNESMRPARWIAAAVGMTGVFIVIGPQLSGAGGAWLLLLLATSPLFAASFLITKAQTRYESSAVIVAWQALMVTLLSIPLATLHWRWPPAWLWLLALLAGLLGAVGQYCQTRALVISDASATQSVKFLDLLWAVALGWMLFGDVPNEATVIGGLVICTAVVGIARHEARGRLRR